MRETKEWRQESNAELSAPRVRREGWGGWGGGGDRWREEGKNKETQMQSSSGPRPIRPLSSRSPTLIGGLSAFCINSQIIRLQHSLFSLLQSFSLSPHLFDNSSFFGFIRLSPPSLNFHLFFLYLCHKLQFLCYSHPPSLPPSIPSSSVSFHSFKWFFFSSEFIFSCFLFLHLSLSLSSSQ